MEPAIFDHLGSHLRLLVVALHDIRTFDKNLSVFRNFHFHILYNLAHIANSNFFFRTNRSSDYWRSLRQSIAFTNPNSSCPEHSRKTRLKRRSTRVDLLNISTQGFSPFGENKLVGNFQLEIIPATHIRSRVVFKTQFQCPEKQFFLDSSKFIALGNDLIVDFFK